MPSTVDLVNGHREFRKWLEHAFPTNPPPHLSFVSSRGKVKPAHQAVSYHGTPKSVLVSQESATPSHAYQSSENFSDFLLPAVGPIEEILLRLSFRFRYSDSDSTNNTCRIKPSLPGFIDRLQIYLNNSSTADLVITAEDMMTNYIFTAGAKEKQENSETFGFDNDINGEVKSSDLSAAFTLAKDTDSATFERTFALRTPLANCRIAPRHCRNDIKIRIYYATTAPVTVSNDDSSGSVDATATLVNSELVVQYSEVDQSTDESLRKLYASPNGITWNTWATTRSEHPMPSGATGTVHTETLPQHTSAGTFANLLYITDTASTVGLDVGGRKMTSYPFNVVHADMDDGQNEIEDPNNRNLVRLDSIEFKRQHIYPQCNFHGPRSGYTGLIWIPYAFDVHSAIGHGVRSGSIAYDDGGKFKLKITRSTGMHNKTTQTLNLVSYCYATIRCRGGMLSYERL
jgi:hypothetical protein